MSLVEFPPTPRLLSEEQEILSDTLMDDEGIVTLKEQLRVGHNLVSACAGLASHIVTYSLSLERPYEEGNPYRQGPTIRSIEDMQVTTAQHAIMMYSQILPALELPGAEWPEGVTQPHKLLYGLALHKARFREIILNGEEQ